MIKIMALADRDYLANRQERMVNGLIECGVPLEEIKGLQWYDPRLEVVDTGPSVDVDTAPVDASAEVLVDAAERKRQRQREWVARKRAEKAGDDIAG